LTFSYELPHLSNMLIAPQFFGLLFSKYSFLRSFFKEVLVIGNEKFILLSFLFLLMLEAGLLKSNFHFLIL